jgi:hypothetical protein
MSLAAQAWSSISVNDAIAEFLLSERHKLAQLPPNMLVMVDHPNTGDPRENHLRLRLLFYIRAQLFCEIPPDTGWFEVRCLHDEDLAELRVIGRCGWDHPNDSDNRLFDVAKRKALKLQSAPADWRKPILWGHSKNGPFTILEGNNRLTAYVADRKTPGLNIPVIVGLSPTLCIFHKPDHPPRALAGDLWKDHWPPFRY